MKAADSRWTLDQMRRGGVVGCRRDRPRREPGSMIEINDCWAMECNMVLGIGRGRGREEILGVGV